MFDSFDIFLERNIPKFRNFSMSFVYVSIHMTNTKFIGEECHCPIENFGHVEFSW